MTDKPIRALVVDDEPLARQAIREFLQDVDGIDWIGDAADGESAVQALETLGPDLVFLDIQMPGASGIEVLERAKANVLVIFTTAHDEYAMTAFELGAIDFLRKPFGRERFMRAILRARPFLAARIAERMAAHVQSADVASTHEADTPLAERLLFAQNESRVISRLFVRNRASIVPVQTRDVFRFEADGDYVAVITGSRRYLVYVNLSDLSARLEPEKFVRIHRSHIINLDCVSAMVPHDANRLEVRMTDGARIVASRNGTQLLRSRIG